MCIVQCGNFLQLFATVGNFLQLLATIGNFWQLLATFGNIWQLLVTFSNFWQLLVTIGNFWQLLATFSNLWQIMAIFQHCNITTFYTDQLDVPVGWTRWTDQLDGPAGQTRWTDQLNGPVLFTWSLGQFAYLKIDVSVLSQLPSLTKALFFYGFPDLITRIESLYGWGKNLRKGEGGLNPSQQY